ncbi:polyribonucleotide nucleotidyltransferase [Hornefia butyriciproducens]|uniref:polyribonucleotide nucleotidyltransferase n=1 Tax=Hornefia butyriciproducens TaxID=2652293 RepID=UPI0029FC1861|nr:polyribonucleotide nucleotidyltransferase [Hornefia butyriciproducens]MCI7326320.1 polyribonucleotide nucleotidyltransferase [Clostridiales bacterium]MDD7019334.1 polyribonucleotide nucleotidyltransferase [Hornefia butyriciproducens]MDY2989921.1 polyribonucleotide nucleotidyltransferase [Hornefia butyriciproducens]MDY5422881.1 polyribonucleotide nucleotidyltransferase [Hornefia butyriciproducens]MDY5462487.1 polyribonucleotide nucleotidyltransferase [Hornefia butyriciproducens]
MARFTDYRTFKMAIGGRLLQLEIGKVCEQANGQVMVRYGESVVNVTVCASKEPREGADFFPLTCDYEERMYAAGKIPGGFIRREGRPSEKAILSCRLMDRPLRPLFPKGFYNDVSVVATVMSVDPDCETDVMAMIGSSVALAISDIPWDGPTGSVRVGRVDGEFVINPTLEQREVSDINLTVAGTGEAIMMVEAGAEEVPESVMLDAIFYAHEEIKKLVAFIDEVVAEVGKPKMDINLITPPEELEAAVRAFATDRMNTALHTPDKLERLDNMDAVEVETQEHFAEEFPEGEKDIASILFQITKECMRAMVLDEGVRVDNRKLDEIRPVWCETGLLPRVHGTGLFKRGQTQALSACTLAPLSEVQRIDGLTEQTEKRYIHHYNFPGYSTGEPKPPRSPGRREIGHGALAERALLPVLPDKEEFPYAIRVVSDILSSNGSTSMASTCGSCLALMDAGVPIRRPVAGIAMGLIERVEEDGTSKMAILSDIQGMEDFMGDMDFKVTGTEVGVTAMQMDIKVHGLSREIMEQALRQAREGRMHIMEIMKEEIAEPRPELSKYAPRCISMTIDPDKIRIVIGPGGKTINKIVDECNVKIDIDEDDLGLVTIYSENMEGAEEARRRIELLTKDVEVGEVYEGTVMRIMNFGAFIEVLPGKEGLLHISKMAKGRVERVEDVMNIGDKVMVKVYEIDKQNRINLVRADLDK